MRVLLLFFGVVVSLGLVSVASAQERPQASLLMQQQVMAPLSIEGDVGVGYSSLQEGTFSSSSPAVNVNADISGYWRDPKILLFDVEPIASYGNALASGTSVRNTGDGFTGYTTVLGGSFYPLTVSYTRLWQQLPTYSSTGNVLSSQSTSIDTNDLSLEWNIHWRKMPPLALRYDTGGVNTDFSGSLTPSNQTHTLYSVSSYYNLHGWYLNGFYSQNTINMSRVNLTDVEGPAQLEINHIEDLHASIQRSQLPLYSSLNLTGGKETWDDNLSGLQANNTFYYGRAYASSHPFPALLLNANAGYDSNVAAEEMQQLLGFGGGGTPTLNVNSFSSGHSTQFGGGAQLALLRGFSVDGDATVYSISSSQSQSNSDTQQWDATLEYVHKLQRAGSVTASYGDQQSQTDSAAQIFKTRYRILRAGFTNTFAHHIQVSATVHYDQSLIENDVASSGSIQSPGDDYGFTFTAGRRLNDEWRLSGDFQFFHASTEFPVHVVEDNKSLDIRLDSRALKLSVRRSYQSGLAMQVGSGLLFVNNLQNALLTPLGTALSMNSTVQTMIIGSYEPGKKRLSVNGYWTLFGYSNHGSQVSNATMFNGVISYRLRLLHLQAGYVLSDSHLSVAGGSGLQRQEVYFEVIRHFRF